jgi:hypothetical protein
MDVMGWKAARHDLGGMIRMGRGDSDRNGKPWSTMAAVIIPDLIRSSAGCFAEVVVFPDALAETFGVVWRDAADGRSIGEKSPSASARTWC